MMDSSTVEELEAFAMFIAMGEEKFNLLVRWLHVENLYAGIISNPRYDYRGLLLIVSYYVLDSFRVTGTFNTF